MIAFRSLLTAQLGSKIYQMHAHRMNVKCVSITMLRTQAPSLRSRFLGLYFTKPFISSESISNIILEDSAVPQNENGNLISVFPQCTVGVSSVSFSCAIIHPCTDYFLMSELVVFRGMHKGVS